ncbi:hypothetical protein CBER1_06585 [Cercospora berteroae]|uniref:Uncharacterized protein n=1 Tax=Cercospora berteroae TaxID=357750 RepID=A0A2S6C3H8_9PEZI|nr:hypothetical protein CBER1_06585 [Cercospora berteroae]
MARISQEFIAKLAMTINPFNVPCVLWGHCLLNVHGVPSIIGSIDFIVPDEQLQLSIGAISTQARRLAPCHDPDTCPFGSKDRFTPPPAFHMHVRDDLNITVGLFPQSDTLWFLPPLAKALPDATAKPHGNTLFAVASDSTILPPLRPGRGSGVFTDKDSHPVVVPQAAVLLEAYMRLFARDAEKNIGSFAMAMIDYVEQYIDEDGLLDVNLLPDPLGWFYLQLKSGEIPVRQWTKELRGALGVRS